MRHGEHGLIVPIGDADALVSAIESTLAHQRPRRSEWLRRDATEQELSQRPITCGRDRSRSLAASRAADSSQQL